MPESPNREENVAIFALTRRGAALAARIGAGLPGSACFCNARYALPGMTPFRKISDVFPSAWKRHRFLVCVMSCGIAVRNAAPLLRDKTVDPAVVVVGEDGRFAVSLLSGHLGGANELAKKVARITDGEAVITTASDLRGKPSVDLIAQKAGLKIENAPMLGIIGAAILDEDPLWVFDPEGWFSKHLPEGHPFEFLPSTQSGGGRGQGSDAAGRPPVEASGDDVARMRAGPGIWVSELPAPPGVRCLQLRPPSLVIGIGCNRGTKADEILAFVAKVLDENRLSPLSIRNFATLDLKSDEQGLLEAAGALGQSILFCAREEIGSIAVPNPSDTVARHVGTESVCEASALWSARTRNLLVAKRKSGNCTLAIARARCP